jgi:membrane-bound lytic murein transglycosylase B
VFGAGTVVLVVVLAVVGVVGAGVVFVYSQSGPLPAVQAWEIAEAPPAAAPATTTDRREQPSRSGGRPTVAAEWVARMSTTTGIPVPALRAYADAELTLRAEQPACRVGWNTLAGIGWVESHHGTIGGRSLRPDGHSSTPILGPALDGVGPVAAIRSTPESAAWHGDSQWEHAVGPMQFLPSSWDRWGGDGDGDGAADPRDLDDAALAAGRYLCADGHDLTTDGGWTAAVHSYNHDDAYVRAVVDAANAYAQRASQGNSAAG